MVVFPVLINTNALLYDFGKKIRACTYRQSFSRLRYMNGLVMDYGLMYPTCAEMESNIMLDLCRMWKMVVPHNHSRCAVEALMPESVYALEGKQNILPYFKD
jgi:hypothetical protein